MKKIKKIVKKLSPKESVIKGLETRKKNLVKKLDGIRQKSKEDMQSVLNDINVVDIQLNALKK